MKPPILALSPALLMLAGCSLLFPPDPREGEEAVEDCAARVEQLLEMDLNMLAGDESTVFVPTYTYDITKLSLEAIQQLSTSDGDETQGTRIVQATNETSTAVDRFMQQDVDANGAFFMGTDPALFRVQGQAGPRSGLIAAGCARQQADMRLIHVDFGPVASRPSSTDTDL